MLAPRSATVQIGGSTYSTTMTLQKQVNSYGNEAWNEQVWSVQIAADTPPAGGFDLDFASTTNQSRADEGYGIGTFTVKAR
jgi:Tfp pilus assembly protein PilV